MPDKALSHFIFFFMRIDYDSSLQFMTRTHAFCEDLCLKTIKHQKIFCRVPFNAQQTNKLRRIEIQ